MSELQKAREAAVLRRADMGALRGQVDAMARECAALAARIDGTPGPADAARMGDELRAMRAESVRLQHDLVRAIDAMIEAESHIARVQAQADEARKRAAFHLARGAAFAPVVAGLGHIRQVLDAGGAGTPEAVAWLDGARLQLLDILAGIERDAAQADADAERLAALDRG